MQFIIHNIIKIIIILINYTNLLNIIININVNK